MNLNYEVGDTIVYQTWSFENRTVLVDNKDPDIKNGRAGFDGIISTGPDTGMSVWGYDDQIVRVVR